MISEILWCIKTKLLYFSPLNDQNLLIHKPIIFSNFNPSLILVIVVSIIYKFKLPIHNLIEANALNRIKFVNNKISMQSEFVIFLI